MRRLAHWLRHVAFVWSGGPEITLVELWLRNQDSPALYCRPGQADEFVAAVTVPFEFQSIVSLVEGWPHWSVVYAA